MRIAAAILTGGKASRLGGIVKGLLVGAGDIPLLERLISELAIAGVHEVILSANDLQHYARFGKPLVADLHPGSGPLGGIEASLDYLAKCCESVIFLPCDLPNISAVENNRTHSSPPVDARSYRRGRDPGKRASAVRGRSGWETVGGIGCYSCRSLRRRPAMARIGGHDRSHGQPREFSEHQYSRRSASLAAGCRCNAGNKRIRHKPLRRHEKRRLAKDWP